LEGLINMWENLFVYMVLCVNVREIRREENTFEGNGGGQSIFHKNVLSEPDSLGRPSQTLRRKNNDAGTFRKAQVRFSCVVYV
jgi:hypothetical protein